MINRLFLLCIVVPFALAANPPGHEDSWCICTGPPMIECWQQTCVAHDGWGDEFQCTQLPTGKWACVLNDDE